MPTIKEIAKLAGVSRGTVDRVLNNRGSVNPATAEKVRRIAEELDYKPNKAGLILAALKKYLKIGVILSSDSSPLFQDIIAGITAKEQELSGYNCTVVLRQPAFEETAQFNTMEELLAEEINGLVLEPYNSLYIAAEIDRFRELGIPVITIHTDITSKRMAHVGCDYKRSGQAAAGLMGRMTFGDVHAGIITGPKNVYGQKDRILSFIDTLEQKYPNIRAIAIAENHDDDEEGFRQVTDMINEHPELNALYFDAGGVCGGCKAVQTLQRTGSIRIFTYDCGPKVRELLREGVITATICQQPFWQGYLSIELISRYLLEGIEPEKEFHYADAEIRIWENL